MGCLLRLGSVSVGWGSSFCVGFTLCKDVQDLYFLPFKSSWEHQYHTTNANVCFCLSLDQSLYHVDTLFYSYPDFHCCFTLVGNGVCFCIILGGILLFQFVSSHCAMHNLYVLRCMLVLHASTASRGNLSDYCSLFLMHSGHCFIYSHFRHLWLCLLPYTCITFYPGHFGFV